MAPVVVLALVLAFLCACGHNEEAKAAQHREEQLNTAREQIAKNTKQLHKLQGELKVLSDLAQNNQATLDKTLQDIRENLKKVSDSNDELDASLTPPPAVEKKSAAGAGWSWFVRILLFLVIIAILIFLLKRLTREDDTEDDLDSEYQEENDLGTVRYPGIQSPAPPEPQPSAKPGEGQAGKPI
jgi:ABC-type transporter Mla subunit MlaD